MVFIIATNNLVIKILGAKCGHCYIMGRMWETLGHWSRNAIGFCKQNFIGYSNRSSENSGDNNMDGKDPAHEVSEEGKELISSWVRGHSCRIVAKNLVKLKNNRLFFKQIILRHNIENAKVYY